MSTSPMDDLKAYAASLAASVTAEETDAVVARVLHSPRGVRVPLKRRVTAVGIAVATFLSANVGLAAAAQNAAPGDVLYGVDRAYERIAGFVGISTPRTEERLQEASELAGRSDPDAALAAASAALEALSASLDVPGNELSEASTSVRDATKDLADLPPANGGRPEFAESVLAETRQLLIYLEEVRLEAKSGNPGAAAAAARDLRNKAKAISDAARQNGKGQGAPPNDPGNPNQP